MTIDTSIAYDLVFVFLVEQVGASAALHSKELRDAQPEIRNNNPDLALPCTRSHGGRCPCLTCATERIQSAREEKVSWEETQAAWGVVVGRRGTS